MCVERNEFFIFLGVGDLVCDHLYSHNPEKAAIQNFFGCVNPTGALVSVL